MKHKFSFKMKNKTMIDFDRTRFAMAQGQLKEDTEYELVIRLKPKWDVEGMRKYFHGPVRKFVKARFHSDGYHYSVDEVKEYFKYKYGKKDDKGVPISTSHYDYEMYCQFLSDIKNWVRVSFKCELPERDEVE
jgi:hypothetical protein